MTKGGGMKAELIILVALIILRCIMDYLQLKDELEDMKQDDEDDEEV